MITIPIISTLYSLVLQNIETEFEATINPFGKAVLRAIGMSDAGQLKLLYLALGLLQKNVAPDTCDFETLVRYGIIWLNRRPRQAVAGKYTAQVTGTIGAKIKVNTTWLSDEDSLNPGQLYILDEEYTLVASPDTITVRAMTAGLEGQLNLGDTITATAPMAQVDRETTITAETVEPLSAETEQEYRQAVLNSRRLESLGGAPPDYRIWAADVQGVKQVYAYASPGNPSEVDLYVEAKIDDSIDDQGTPSQAMIDAVEAVVNFDPDNTLENNERGRRPTQCGVNYLPVTPKVLVVTINDFEDLTAQTQADILTALNTLIDTIRPYVAGAEPLADKNDIINVAKLNGVIYTAKPGAIYSTVEFTVDGVSVSSYQFLWGDIPYLNQSIVYT